MKPIFSQSMSPSFGALKVLTPNQQKREPLSLLIQMQGPDHPNLDQGAVDTIAFVRSPQIATLSSAPEKVGLWKKILKMIGLGGKPGADEWKQIQSDLVQLFGPNGDCHPAVAGPKQTMAKRFMVGPHAQKPVIDVLKEVHPQLYKALQDGTVTLAQGGNPEDLLIRVTS